VMLDEAGYEDVKITVSNSLDEFIIKSVLENGAKIDSFGVGERLITARSEPVFGGVYKLVAIEKDNEIIPKIKISENVEKITNPAFKKLYRIYDKSTDKAIADLITLHNEVVDNTLPLELFDPSYTWKRKKIKDYYCKELMVKVFESGSLVYSNPSVMDIREFSLEERNKLWPEVLRLQNPHKYYVDLSHKLWELKEALLHEYSSEFED